MSVITMYHLKSVYVYKNIRKLIFTMFTFSSLSFDLIFRFIFSYIYIRSYLLIFLILCVRGKGKL